MISFPFTPNPVEDRLTKERLVETSDHALALANEWRSHIAVLDSAPDTQLNWENTFGTMDDIRFAIAETVDLPALLALVHPDAEIREIARTYEPKVSAFTTELYLDDAVYRVLKRAETLIQSPSPEQKKLISETLRDYRRNGLELNHEKREELKALNEKLTSLTQTFEKNIAEATVSIRVTPEQLSGLPETFIANHQPDADGLVTITSDPPDLTTFLRYADDRSAVLDLYSKSENRCAELNLPILDEVLKLRAAKASLLGYRTWANYVLEERMAKTPDRVKTFLDSLHKGLRPIRDKEMETIERIARAHGKPSDKQINVADSAYYAEKVRNIEYGLDSKELSAYFEINAVKQGVIDIASTLFGVTFRHCPNIKTWHPEVDTYEILDQQGTMLARFYLDLYPRDDKYKHGAMFTIRPTTRLEDGTRIVPEVALVCNFEKPGHHPALLDHTQVDTLFHEFGHCLHATLGQSTYATFSGTGVAWDFVEVPSQLFEEWAWNRESLNRFAMHHLTNEPIPDKLFQAMKSARMFGMGINTDRQLFLANLDLAYHNAMKEVDTTAVMIDLHKEYSPFERIPDTYFQSHFGHLMGYDASYYSYQWALSIAMDIFTRFESEGIMNTQTASSYLHAILERGGSEDEEKMVESFLGRPSSPKAYLDFLGIEEETGGGEQV